MTFPGHRWTVCGSRELVSIASGSEADTAADLFRVSSEHPVRAWCAEHAPHLVARLAALRGGGGMRRFSTGGR